MKKFLFILFANIMVFYVKAQDYKFYIFPFNHYSETGIIADTIGVTDICDNILSDIVFRDKTMKICRLGDKMEAIEKFSLLTNPNLCAEAKIKTDSLPYSKDANILIWGNIITQNKETKITVIMYYNDSERIFKKTTTEPIYLGNYTTKDKRLGEFFKEAIFTSENVLQIKQNVDDEKKKTSDNIGDNSMDSDCQDEFLKSWYALNPSLDDMMDYYASAASPLGGFYIDEAIKIISDSTNIIDSLFTKVEKFAGWSKKKEADLINENINTIKSTLQKYSKFLGEEITYDFPEIKKEYTFNDWKSVITEQNIARLRISSALVYLTKQQTNEEYSDPKYSLSVDDSLGSRFTLIILEERKRFVKKNFDSQAYKTQIDKKIMNPYK